MTGPSITGADVRERLEAVRARIAKAMEGQGGAAPRDPGSVTLIAVSKTYDGAAIAPALDAGQTAFGENRVQEAQGKWPDLRRADTALHLIGPLQSNKAGDAVALFDAIHTIDRDKIAAAVAKEMKKRNRAPELFVQVNTGEEPQKAGVAPQDAADFVRRCREHHGLAPVGLMCIPPADENAGPHFALLAKMALEIGDLPFLSMGMSGDFEQAIAFGATHVRVGSAVFGERDYG